MSFYIKELNVTGNGKKPAIVQFKKGLNIIVGPSNTGKTLIFKCIDYIFGAKYNPLMEGYDCISLKIEILNSEITLTRHVEKNIVLVKSSFECINSGEYKYTTGRDDYEASFNSVLLKLINIFEHHEIVKNSNYKKQSLTWRTFSSAFFINEDSIISEQSPLLPIQYTERTPFLSALVFLLTGKDFSSVSSVEAKDIKRAKKSAIKEYISNELQELSKQTELLNNELNEMPDLDNIINLLSIEIEATEENIVQKINNNKQLLDKIQKLNEELAELNVLLNNYDLLESQYDSDLKRLNFIVDGQINYEQTEKTICPFCSTNISVSKKEDYITASLNSYKKIKLQKDDLIKAKDNLKERIEVIEKKLKSLYSEKNEVISEIEKKLQPKLNDLKGQLEIYKNKVEKRKEINILNAICTQKTEFLNKQENEKDSENKYDPRDYLDYSFTSDFSKFIEKLLIESHYDNLNSVIFSNISMDISINGKEKKTNGKGYRAYFNSLLSIAFIKYLYANGKYKQNLLLIDSPILSLKLSENEEIGMSIKKGLFEILRDINKELQVIVFENKIPDIEYKSTNIIEFTKDKKVGRFGFLPDVYN